MVVLLMGYITGIDRHQITLMPERIEDYISKNNPVRVIDAFVENLDVAETGFRRAHPAKEGRPGYDPKTLLRLYIYGYFNKVRSSRKLMAECERNLEVMWLIRRLKPDFRTIADFRKDNRKALKKVFRAFVNICLELNLYSKELVAIDGSKFRAVNSKNKNVTKTKLEKQLKRVDKRLEEYLNELDKEDKENAIIDKPTIEEIQAKIVKLNKQKETYNGYLTEMEKIKETQKSFTDPESRLMRTHSGGFEVSYNVQTAVDEKNHMIVDFDATNNCNDIGLLSEVAKNAKAVLGAATLEVIADNGYESSEDTLKCLKEGIIPNVALKRGVMEQEIMLDYKAAVIVPKVHSSTKPKDIEKCLAAGVLPAVYRHENIEIEILEKIKNGPSNKCFRLNEHAQTVTCPEGEILRKSAYLKKKKATRFVNRAACSSCKNKCTRSAFKQVDLKDGQVTLYLNDPNHVTRQVVIRIKPDKEKLKRRKCIVEHPFGTVKRWCDGSYLLMKGKEKANADLALSFLAYNIKRAINIKGVQALIEAMG